MTYYRKQLPKYCLHKATGRAYVRIGGKMYYLGKHGTEASRRKYDQMIGEYVANGRQAFQHPDEILIESLIIRYLDHVENEQNFTKNAKDRIRISLRLLNEPYGQHLVTQFSPTGLKSIRRQLLDRGLSRGTINAYIGTIQQVFDWGAGEEIVSPAIAGALRTVKALQKGRSTAVEYDPTAPVDDEIVEKTLKYIKSPQIRDMIRVQRLICGRPQDVHNMRYCDIEQSGEVWKYTPFTHKTKKRGKIRMLPIGPRAQKILKPYLERCKDEDFVFPRPKAKTYQNRYATQIALACKKAGVPVWTPNQLRHRGGTEVREKFGLDAAQVILGHSNASTTEIYAKLSFEKAAWVAREIG